MALAELAAVGAQHHGVVCEARRAAAQRREQQQLPRRVGEMVVAADDVRDAHVAVVDDRGEVVAGHAVRAHDDEVADGVGAHRDAAADNVVDDYLAARHVKAQGGGFAVREAPPDILRCQPEAAAVVARRPPLRQRRGARFGQAFLRAEAVVGMAAGQQPLSRRAVALQAFALSVGCAGASLVGPLVPVQPQPAQVGEDRRLECRSSERTASVSSTRSTKLPSL